MASLVASLVVHCRKHFELHFIQRSGCSYLRASVGWGAAEVRPSSNCCSSNGGNGERLHFPGKAENSKFALDVAKVVKHACLREAIGNPNNARKAG